MSKKAIINEIDSLTTLGELSHAYAEIASGRMKKTRDSVLQSRGFLAAIDSIFSEVRESYRREVLALAKKKKGKEGITFLAHNGKTTAVFLSANTGLYGDIVPRTFRLFMQELKNPEVEATIIGRLGLSLFLEEAPTRPYTYFDLPDYGIDRQELEKIVRHLAPYEEIHIYHGKFQNIVRQEPTLFNISAETPLSTAGVKEEKGRVRYLFEPTLEEILIFFESEMFTSLLEQAVRESQLAKFASRMLAMDKAGENIRQRLGRVKLDMLRFTHASANRKQLNTFASVFLWKKQ